MATSKSLTPSQISALKKKRSALESKGRALYAKEQSNRRTAIRAEQAYHKSVIATYTNMIKEAEFKRDLYKKGIHRSVYPDGFMYAFGKHEWDYIPDYKKQIAASEEELRHYYL